MSKALLQRYLDQGYSWHRIAEAEGCSYGRVQYWMNKHGLKSTFQQHQSANRELRTVGRKRCATCRVDHDFAAFDRDPRAADGLTSQCKTCRTATTIAWQEHNPDRVRAASNRWKERNPERVRAYSKKYWAEHKESEYAKFRDYMTPERNAYYLRLRRDRKRGAVGDCSLEQLRARIAYYGGLCWMCGAEADTIDHVIPISGGGTEWPANLRPACRSCNSSKGASRLN